MTEKETAHPTTEQLNDLSAPSTNGDLVTAMSPTSTTAPPIPSPEPPKVPENCSATESSSEGCNSGPNAGLEIQPPDQNFTLGVEQINITAKVRFSKKILTVL